LAEKLAHLFKNHLIPFAGKAKAKDAEDDKNFKIAQPVFEDFDE